MAMYVLIIAHHTRRNFKKRGNRKRNEYLNELLNLLVYRSSFKKWAGKLVKVDMNTNLYLLCFIKILNYLTPIYMTKITNQITLMAVLTSGITLRCT